MKIWEEQRSRVQEYLQNGVVPSTLTKTNGEGSDVPNAVTLLNSSIEFCVESLHLLLDKIHEVDVNSIKDRAYWAKRIEFWTAKAIEDSVLLEHRVI